MKGTKLAFAIIALIFVFIFMLAQCDKKNDAPTKREGPQRRPTRFSPPPHHEISIVQIEGKEWICVTFYDGKGNIINSIVKQREPAIGKI
jgi:hypothetical protein